MSNQDALEVYSKILTRIREIQLQKLKLENSELRERVKLKKVESYCGEILNAIR